MTLFGWADASNRTTHMIIFTVLYFDKSQHMIFLCNDIKLATLTKKVTLNQGPTLLRHMLPSKLLGPRTNFSRVHDYGHLYYLGLAITLPALNCPHELWVKIRP